jgi:hypothetical protein
VSRFFYWVIVLISLILGINALEVAATQTFIAQFCNYLAHLFAAILILVVGYLIAIFLGQATLIAAVNAQMESAKLLSRTVRWFIIILALTMALYHLGVAEKIIVAAFTIIFGGMEGESWRRISSKNYPNKGRREVERKTRFLISENELLKFP